MTPSGSATAPRRRHAILGTAGHIDHGKSSLVRALTGTDPDRLPEEQARGMTIELGFAQLSLDPDDGPSPRSMAIVDVPGHERFVRTMVAGATGIDLAMLVVAADDGVMPQTREHLEILDLLGVASGVVVITKADLTDEVRIDTVRRQVAELTRGTPQAEWSVVVASAKSGRGLDDLRRVLADLVNRLPPSAVGDVFRLAIDRVFAVHGRGTVVTGSVLAGQVAAGATLELQPPGLPCRVREVQSHGTSLDDVSAGQRAALNLTGIDRERIDRGMELATPGYLKPSRYVDARVRLLARLDKPFPSHRRVRACMGTTEAMAMLVVLGGHEIVPGGDAPVQLRFTRPVVAAFGQRFIIRNETAQWTLGGGLIVRPVSSRFRPSEAEERAAFRRAESDDAFVRYEEAVRRAGFSQLDSHGIARETGIPEAQLFELHERLVNEKKVVSLATGLAAVHRDAVVAIEDRALAYLKRHHAAHPQEPGIPRDRLVGWIEKRAAEGVGRVIAARLESAGRLVARGPYVSHHEFRPELSPDDAALLEQLVREITTAAFDPPAWSALRAVAALSKQRSKMLEDLARCEPRLVQFAPRQFIAASSIEELKSIIRRLGKDRPFKLAQVRDALGASRRVVQPLLEYLDRIQFTRRVGDERILLENAR